MIHQKALGQQLQLARVTLAEQPRFQAAFQRLKQPISDYTFANVYVWGASLDLYWCELRNHLCLFANGTGDLSMLLPPLPEADATPQDMAACLLEAFEVMDNYNEQAGRPGASRIEYVSDEMLELLGAASPAELNLSAAPMSGDFVYPSSRMIDLAGGDLKSKRHGRSKFMRDYPDFTTALLDDGHIADCLAMIDRWRRYADESHGEQVTEDEAHTLTALLREKEAKACRSALQHRKALNLTGMVVYVGGQLVGFTLGQAISPAQASILFEKTDPDFHGCPQLIFSEFCHQCWHDLPEINAGDDWGIPTLRFTKESYRPSRRLSKYVLTRTPAPMLTRTETVESAPEAAAPTQTTQTRSIRPATLADLPQLLAIEHCTFELADAFSWQQIRRLVSNPRLICRVVETPENEPAAAPRVAGWAVGLIRQHPHHRSGRLYNIAIDPLQQGGGLGRLLTSAVLAELEAAGCRHIYLEVRSDNDRAVALYRKLGFEVVRSLRGYYGPGNDGLSMRRISAGVAPLPDNA